MHRPHILLMQVSKSTYLFPVSWEIKYAPYIVNTHYISCGGGGEPPSVGVTSFQRQYLRGES
jgi:hypothetical protein